MTLHGIIDRDGLSRRSNPESKPFPILDPSLPKEANPEAGQYVQGLSLCVHKLKAESPSLTTLGNVLFHHQPHPSFTPFTTIIFLVPPLSTV